jgi:hypothetical protein
MITADQQSADILVAPDVRVGRGVFHRGDGVHRPTTCGVLGIIKDHIAGLSYG